MTGGSEPFPPLTAAADRQFHSAPDANVTRRRRKSSILGSELRVGDTGAPALATSIAHLNGTAKVCFPPAETVPATTRETMR
jgi:acyl-CoA-dependent ceramide synthase